MVHTAEHVKGKMFSTKGAQIKHLDMSSVNKHEGKYISCDITEVLSLSLWPSSSQAFSEPGVIYIWPTGCS